MSDEADHEAPGGMEGIDEASEPVTDSDDPGGMSAIPDPDPDKDTKE
jgi:hypothetical protein